LGTKLRKKSETKKQITKKKEAVSQQLWKKTGNRLGKSPAPFGGQGRERGQILTPAAALPNAPNKAVSTATATFAIVFQCRIIFTSFL
jgi:hypothetical protein